MGFLSKIGDALFGKSKTTVTPTSSSGTSTSSTNGSFNSATSGWNNSSTTGGYAIDPTQRNLLLGAAARMGSATSRPFTQYGGPWTAGFNADQEQAVSGAKRAMDFTAGKGSEFMGQYFNPFLSQVGGNMVSDMLRAQSEQRQSDEDRAIAAGAYGGSRHGVVDSMAERNFDDVLGKNLTDLYARGFDTAAGLGMQDADRGIAGANVNLAGTNALANLGLTRQATEQLAADNERAKFNEARDNPLKMAQAYGDFVKGMPVMGGTNWSNTNGTFGSTTDGTTSSNTNSSFNSTGSAVSESKSPGLLQTVGGLGLLGGMIFSDENIKSDVRSMSPNAVLKGMKKTPVKSWRYDPKKGGPNDGGRPHIGPMAQGMKKNLGIGNGSAMPVVDVLGAHHAAISALAKKVDKVSIKRKGK